MAENALNLLFSSAKLERDKGVLELKSLLAKDNETTFTTLENEILKTLECQELTWETKHGSLIGSKVLLTQKDKDNSPIFLKDIQNHALSLLEDGESRVRLAAGEVIGTLCKTVGTSVYASSKDKILSGIRDNLDIRSRCTSESSESSVNLVDQELRRSLSAEQIFHDTAGWKSLETWMKCLQCVIEGSGTNFNSFIDHELLELVFTTLTHTNRFVRETGYYVCAELVACNIPAGDGKVVSLQDNMIYKNGKEFSQHLSQGLADNWSQVRLAASVAVRNFLQGLPSEETRMQFYGLLLPPLCLNRYYVAEGVRTYNQETWKNVTHGQGKIMVEKFMPQMVDFYFSQTEADNHAVREAACACIAELASKIEKNAVRPFVPRLLDALIVCFKDDSWPVRDASCVACGNFILCFPEESRVSVDSLYPLFYDNLQDNIPSVRQGAAVALVNVVRAYKGDCLEKVVAKVTEGLEGLENQPANVEKYSNLEKGPATFGVVKKLRDNDMELHENNTMYSCGSLAPKMGRGNRSGGCMDHQFRKPVEPWELADGKVGSTRNLGTGFKQYGIVNNIDVKQKSKVCVCLLGELSQVPEAANHVTKRLPLLAKAASHRQYTQHVVFLETLCKQLCHIAKGLGKRTFKTYLEMFFDAIFYSVTCDNALTSAAASNCLSELSALLGPNILKGRVEQFDPRYLQYIPAATPMSGFPGSPAFPQYGARMPGEFPHDSAVTRPPPPSFGVHPHFNPPVPTQEQFSRPVMPSQ